MVVDGARGEKQPLGDLGVARPVGDEPEDVELPRGELAGVGGRVDRRGPRGMSRAPTSRSRRATMRASGPAPRRWSSAEGLPQRLLVGRPRRARGPSRTGRPRAAPRSRRSAPVAGELERPGLVDVVGDVVHDPVLASPVRELAEPPRAGVVPLSQERRVGRLGQRLGAPLEPRDLRLRARESARASPDRTMLRRSSPPPSRSGPVSGSPRRARTSASTSNACRRGSGESRISATITSAVDVASVQAPRSSSRRTRSESRASRQRSSSRPSQCASPASIQRVGRVVGSPRCPPEREVVHRVRRELRQAALPGLVERLLERSARLRRGTARRFRA